MSPVNHREKGRPQHSLRSSFHAENPAERTEIPKGEGKKKRGLHLFWADLRSLAPAIGLVLLYGAVTHLIFGRFCPMAILAGLPCPGCGMTRALFLALTGRFSLAWELQPLVYGWLLMGLSFGIRRYLLCRPVLPREKRFWLSALALLLLSSLFLYGYRIFTGFPEGIVGTGRSLLEMLACSQTRNMVY